MNISKLESAIEKKLDELGVPSKLNGYHYIKTGCMLVYKDDRLLSLVTKILYPEIAKIHSTTVVRVERSMRNAIDVMFKRNDKLRKRPTNSALITTIVASLQ